MIYASAKARQNGRVVCRVYVRRDVHRDDAAETPPWKLVVVQEVEDFLPDSPRVFSFDFWGGDMAFGAFIGFVRGFEDEDGCEVKCGFGPFAEL